MSQTILGADGQQFSTGWVADPEGAAKWADEYCLRGAYESDFWRRLADADDGHDRFWYRALVIALERSKVSAQWLRADGNFLRIIAMNQANIGSCVGNADAKRQSHEAALDVYLRGQPELFVAMFSPEIAYGAGREAGQTLGPSDGSTGFGMRDGCLQIGQLPQGKYDRYDLTTYSVSTCRQFGMTGVPSALKPLCAKHTNKTFIQVRTGEEAWLACGAGHIVNVCSNVGYEAQSRDSDGACRPSGSWSHSMCLGAARYTTKSGRRLLLIENSWGDYLQGPYYLDQPIGSFYADVASVDRMVKQGDTFAVVDYGGEIRPTPPEFTEM